MWAQGVRTQDSAFTIASTDAMLCDRFADAFSVTCSCMKSAAAAEAETSSVGGGHPSLNEPSPSSSSCSSDAITVFLDEPCVVGKASEGSPVQERPQRQSPLEIQHNIRSERKHACAVYPTRVISNHLVRSVDTFSVHTCTADRMIQNCRLGSLVALIGCGQIQELLRCCHDTVVSCSSCFMHWRTFFFLSQVSSSPVERNHVAIMWAQGFLGQDSAFTIVPRTQCCVMGSPISSQSLVPVWSGRLQWKQRRLRLAAGRPSLSEPVAAATHSLNCWDSAVQERSQLESPLDIQLYMLRGCASEPRASSTRMVAQRALLAQRPPSLFSKSTDDLQAVVSHNWSVGRSRMWLALSLHWYFPQRSSLWCPHCRSTVCASSLEWLSLSAVDVGPLLASGISRPTFYLSGGARLRPMPTWGQPGRFRSGRCGPKLTGGGASHREKKLKTRRKTFGEKSQGVGQST